VHEVALGGEDGGDDTRLETVELTETADRKTQAYHVGVVAEALEEVSGRRAGGHNRLDDAAPVGGRVVTTVWMTPRRSSARVSAAAWFCIPPMGSNLTPFPTSAEGGGSNTEQSLSTLIGVTRRRLCVNCIVQRFLSHSRPDDPYRGTIADDKENQTHSYVRPSAGRVGERAHWSKMGKPPGFRSPPAPAMPCMRSKSSLRSGPHAGVQEGLGAGQAAFHRGGSRGCALSAEACYDLTFTRPHPVRRLRTDPNQWLVSDQCE
jgi:hypothetical protein